MGTRTFVGPLGRGKGVEGQETLRVSPPERSVTPFYCHLGALNAAYNHLLVADVNWPVKVVHSQLLKYKSMHVFA